MASQAGQLYVYQLQSGTWNLSNLLMPDDNNLPQDTSTPEADVQEDGTVIFNYNSDAQTATYNSGTNGTGTQSAGAATGLSVVAYDFYEVELAPRTQLALNSIGEGLLETTHSTTIYNDSHNARMRRSNLATT